MKTHTDCIFYTKKIEDFGGCQGLDYGMEFWRRSAGHGSGCPSCPYRLERVKGILKAAEEHIRIVKKIQTYHAEVSVGIEKNPFSGMQTRLLSDIIETQEKLKEAVGK